MSSLQAHVTRDMSVHYEASIGLSKGNTLDTVVRFD